MTIAITALGVGVLVQCGAPTALLAPRQSSTRAVSESSLPITERPSGLNVSALSETGSVEASDLWPDSTRTDRFKRSISAQGDAVIVRRAMTRENDGTVSILIRDENAEKPIARTRLGLEPDGAVGILSHESDGILSRFEPPPGLVPASLSAGQTVRSAFSVQSSGDRIPDGSGEGTGEIEGLGTQTLSSPIGELPCFVLRSSLSFSIGAARITLDQRAWIDQSGRGLGLVAEEGRTRVVVFGIPVHNRARVSLIELAGGAEGDR